MKNSWQPPTSLLHLPGLQGQMWLQAGMRNWTQLVPRHLGHAGWQSTPRPGSTFRWKNWSKKIRDDQRVPTEEKWRVSQGVGAKQRGGETLAPREPKLVGPRQDEVLGSMSFPDTTPPGYCPASSVFFSQTSPFCFLLLAPPYASHHC